MPVSGGATYMFFFPLFFATLFYECMLVGWLISLIYFNALPKEQLIWGMAGVGDRWRTVLSPMLRSKYVDVPILTNAHILEMKCIV